MLTVLISEDDVIDGALTCADGCDWENHCSVLPILKTWLHCSFATICSECLHSLFLFLGPLMLNNQAGGEHTCTGHSVYPVGRDRKEIIICHPRRWIIDSDLEEALRFLSSSFHPVWEFWLQLAVPIVEGKLKKYLKGREHSLESQRTWYPVPAMPWL